MDWVWCVGLVVWVGGMSGESRSEGGLESEWDRVGCGVLLILC